MRNLYNTINEVVGFLNSNPLVSSVTFGELSDVDLNKQTIFPLAHVIVNQASFEGDRLNTVTMQVTVLVMDVVDISKENPRDEPIPYYGTDNLLDVLNQCLAVQNQLASSMSRGSLNTGFYQLVDTAVSSTPFFDRFENNLAGWEATYNIATKNTEVISCP